MALELKQQLKQTQQLLMSPQLQQAIKLLQMSRLELVEHIQQELLENPFLEEVQGSPELSDVDENFSELNENRASSEADEGYSFEEINKNGDWEDYLGEL
ncbi:MAG: RNA polymerase sigma-54 factor, partial [Mailhella sp.]|nr:RNA polymerase sigma-54 factor [Mailhella sp.]